MLKGANSLFHDVSHGSFLKRQNHPHDNADFSIIIMLGDFQVLSSLLYSSLPLKGGDGDSVNSFQYATRSLIVMNHDLTHRESLNVLCAFNQ